MPQIVFPLKLQMKRATVSDLHEVLISLGYEIGDAEKSNKRFGAWTRRAIFDFQQKHGLKPSGKVDKVTAALLSQGTDAPQFIVHGVIRNQDSAPRPGLAVKAFDRNVGADDTLLGQAVTDDQGNYSITYTTEQLGDKGAADMVISVYQDNNLLQTSDVIFNTGKVETKDFVVPEAVAPEFHNLSQNIQSLLRNKNALGKLSETQVDFLSKKT